MSTKDDKDPNLITFHFHWSISPCFSNPECFLQWKGAKFLQAVFKPDCLNVCVIWNLWKCCACFEPRTNTIFSSPILRKTVSTWSKQSFTLYSLVLQSTQLVFKYITQILAGTVLTPHGTEERKKQDLGVQKRLIYILYHWVISQRIKPMVNFKPIFRPLRKPNQAAYTYIVEL